MPTPLLTPATKPYEPGFTITQDILCKVEERHQKEITERFAYPITNKTLDELDWTDKDVLFYYIEAGLPFLIDTEDCQAYDDYYMMDYEMFGREPSRIEQVNFFIQLYQKGMKKVKRKHAGIFEFFTQKSY